MADPAVPPPQESSVMVCLAKRHELRSCLKANVAYMSLGPSSTPFEHLPFRYTMQSCAAFNLVTGTHFVRGATSWRDTSPDEHSLLQSWLNGAAFLTRRKHFDARTQPLVPDMIVTIFIETLVGQCEPNEGQPLGYEVNGYRPWFVTACDPAALRKFAEERRALRTSQPKQKTTKKRPRDAEESTHDGDGGEEAPKRQRNNDGEAVPVDAVDVPVDAHLLDAFSPLAIGLHISHADSHALTKRMREVKAKDAEARQKQSRRSAKNTTPESELPLVLQNVDVTNMVPFRYLRATSDMNFHLQTVTKYTNRNNLAVSSNEEPRKAGQFIDPRPFMTHAAGVQEELRVGVTNRRHPLNPDNIFSKEAAMVYHTRQEDGKRLVCHRQTELANYIEGVADGYMSPHEDADDDNGELLGNDDEALMTLLDHVNANAGAPREAHAFHNKLVNLLALKTPDTAKLRFPFPALVKVLNPAMMSPECMGLLDLPFPIGHRLSQREMETGQRDVLNQDLADMAAHTVALAKYEEALNVSYRLRHPNAPKLGVLSALSANIAETGQRTDVQTNLQLTKLAVPPLASAHEVRGVVEAQKSVVLLTVENEANRVSTDPYQPLFRKVAEPESHNEAMNISDFLPFAFAFLPDHVTTVRGHVEAYLREKYYADMETLAPVERANAEHELHGKTEDLVKQIAEKEVDDIPVYFVEHDEFLKKRIQYKVRAVMLRETIKADMKALREQRPPDYEAECVKLRNFYQIDILRSRFKNADEVLTLMRTSDNIADVLKAPDFRIWFQKTCTPEMMLTLGADVPVVAQDAMPFNTCIQELVDYIFLDMGIRTANGLTLFLVTFATALDSQTWAPARIKPAVSTAVNGPTAVGKSHNARGLQQSIPPGICENLSTFSAQAFNTSSNNDNVFVVQEEGKASLLAPSDDDRKRGGSNELNLIKDLMTRFCSVTKRATTNKETNVTSTTTAVSSAHMSWLLNSNLNTSFIDGPFSRRLIMIVMATLQGEASIQPEQIEELDVLRDDHAKRDSVKRMQLTFAMYMILRAMIKAGVLPMPDRTAANLVIVAVLKELGVRVDSTQLHYFLQFAENYQLFYAAYMICWSPLQAFYHSQKDGAPRWSGQAIIELGTPFVTSVSVPAAIFSLTSLDFLLTPKFLDSFLRDLADALNMAHLDKRNYRRLESIDRNARPEYDVNYLVLEGTSIDNILERVAGENGMYKLRPDDVRVMLNALNKSHVTGKSLTALSFRADGVTPLVIAEDASSDIVSFTPFEYDTTMSGPGRRKRSVFAVSARFLEHYFKRDVCRGEPWVEMHQRPFTIDEDSFNLTQAAEIGRVSLESSAMARAIERVLSNRTTLLSPFDPEKGLPDRCFDFITGFSPLPVKASVNVPQGRNQPPRTEEFRRGLDGILQVLRLPRNPARDPIRRENAHALTSTRAETTRLRRELLARRQRAAAGSDDDDDDADLMNEDLNAKRALIYTTSDYDGEYVLQKYILRMVAAATPPALLRLMGYSEEEIDSYSQGLERFPEALPLGYGPLTYFVQRKICATMGYPVGKVVYPRDNIYKQLKDAMFTHRFKLTPSALRNVNDWSQVADFRTLADAIPLAQVSFDAADRESATDCKRIQTFMDTVMEKDDDAMDIDGTHNA